MSPGLPFTSSVGPVSSSIREWASSSGSPTSNSRASCRGGISRLRDVGGASSATRGLHPASRPTCSRRRVLRFATSAIPRCGRRDNATCSSPGSCLARGARPWKPESPGRPPPGPRSCRLRPAPRPCPHTAFPRAARPSSGLTTRRTLRGSRRRVGGSSHRWRSRRPGP
jgi:hypothetical protein